MKAIKTLLTPFICLWLLLVMPHQSSYGLNFPIADGSDLVGQINNFQIIKSETFGEIGRRFGIGLYELIEANPKVNPWLPSPGTVLTIPSQFILPVIREGIVLNLAELRLYYFCPSKKRVYTYPIGIGRKEWPTPVGISKISAKIKNPTWTPPSSIRAEHALAGDFLPYKVLPGPDNPLGKYAFRIGFDNILMHGTNKPGGIGLRGSHGCIRLLAEDVEELYHLVKVGTPISIIHTPFKIGQDKGTWYLEVHEALREVRFKGSDTALALHLFVNSALESNGKETVNWSKVGRLAEEASGIPEAID